MKLRVGISAVIGLTLLGAMGLSAGPANAAAAPTVTGVSPASGPAKGGNQVSIAGTGFSSVTKVSFGASTSTKITHISSTLIYVTAPKHGVARVDVRVTSSAGTSNASTRDFYYYSAGAPRVTWSKATELHGGVGTPSESDEQLDISCAAQNHCVTISRHGVANTWNGHVTSYRAVDTSAEAKNMGYSSISCPTTTFCVAVGRYSPSPEQSTGLVKVVVLHGSTWSGPFDLHDDNLPIDVSCSSPKSCVVIDDIGHAIVYRNGIWEAPRTVDRTRSLNSISCPSDTFCLAAAGNARFLTFNGTSWSALQQARFPGDRDGIFNITCTMATSCVGSTKTFAPVFRRGSTWGSRNSFEAPDGNTTANISCATTRACIATELLGDPHGFSTYVFDGAASAKTTNPASAEFRAEISCGSPTQCAEIDDAGRFAVARVAS